MSDLRGLAQYFTLAAVVFSLTIILQVSYKVSAYQRLNELSALEALEDRVIDNNLFDSDSSEDGLYDRNEYLPTDKRYARLSYYYGNRGGGNRRYYHNRYYRSRYYQNYYSPWLNLKDTDCFRHKCSSDNDCCRRYSKCDKSAKICYNCWFGHPCKSSRDCCERYPYCNKNAHGGRCQN